MKRALGVPPGGLVVVGKHRGAQQATLHACGAFMDRVIAMEQTQRLFAGWDVYFGLADTLATLRLMRTRQLHLAEADKGGLLERFDLAAARPALIQFAMGYVAVELDCPWLWVAGYLVHAYRSRLAFWVLQPAKPITLAPQLAMIEGRQPGRGRPYTAGALHAEWSFRHRVLGESAESIAEYDDTGAQRTDGALEVRTVYKGIRTVEEHFAHIGLAP